MCCSYTVYSTAFRSLRHSWLGFLLFINVLKIIFVAQLPCKTCIMYVIYTFHPPTPNTLVHSPHSLYPYSSSLLQPPPPPRQLHVLQSTSKPHPTPFLFHSILLKIIIHKLHIPSILSHASLPFHFSLSPPTSLPLKPSHHAIGYTTD